ncbi:hypothetical protein B484DRAFT_461922, partial [Ochromonadaceae sp. CCMP2298]
MLTKCMSIYCLQPPLPHGAAHGTVDVIRDVGDRARRSSAGAGAGAGDRGRGSALAQHSAAHSGELGPGLLRRHRLLDVALGSLVGFPAADPLQLKCGAASVGSDRRRRAPEAVPGVLLRQRQLEGLGDGLAEVAKGVPPHVLGLPRGGGDAVVGAVRHPAPELAGLVGHIAAVSVWECSEVVPHRGNAQRA